MMLIVNWIDRKCYGGEIIDNHMMVELQQSLDDDGDGDDTDEDGAASKDASKYLAATPTT